MAHSLSVNQMSEMMWEEIKKLLLLGKQNMFPNSPLSGENLMPFFSLQLMEILVYVSLCVRGVLILGQSLCLTHHYRDGPSVSVWKLPYLSRSLQT